MPPKSKRRGPNAPTQTLNQDGNHSAPQSLMQSTYPDTRPILPSDLNLSVLRRHYPDVSAIMGIAPYSVIYTFNTTNSSWEKCGIEGTLFVVSLRAPHLPYEETSPNRYGVMVLNRRGLDNFALELVSSEDVEVSAEYIIISGRNMKVRTQSPDAMNRTEIAEVDDSETWGIWVFQEEAPSSTAGKRGEMSKLMAVCAAEAERSAAEFGRAQQQHEQNVPYWQQSWQNQPYDQSDPQRNLDVRPQQSSNSLMGLLSPSTRQQTQLRYQQINDQARDHLADQEQRQQWIDQNWGPPSMQFRMHQSPHANAAVNSLDDLFARARMQDQHY